MKKSAVKNSCLFLLLIITVIGFYLAPAIHQPADYHQFADTRAYFGIPNFSNVISNIFFLIIGLLGLTHLSSINDTFQKTLYGIFFGAIFLVTFGSSYYHWSPNHFSLLWDRIPITIAMMSFLTLIIDERINRRFAKVMLIPLMLIGIATVLYWYLTQTHGQGDLKPYVFTQVFPAIFIPVTLLLYPKNDRAIWWAILMYVIARVAEYYDSGLYLLTHHLISGHTLKHLVMAFGVFLIYLYMKAYNHKSQRT